MVSPSRSFVLSCLNFNARELLRRLALFGISAVVAFAADSEPAMPTDQPVNYEGFGAVGDGVADDLPAIVKAHAFANAHALPVKTKAGATYHLGRRALTAIIATDTDWGTSSTIAVGLPPAAHRPKPACST